MPPLNLTRLAIGERVQHELLVVIGRVGLYQKTGKRQIHLAGPLRVLPAAQVDLHAFLPRIAGDTTRLWDWIDKRRAEITTPPLRGVVDLFYADDAFRLQLEQTPGSVNGHHAKLGGLLLHLFEVTSIARNTAKTMNANVDSICAKDSFSTCST